MFCDVWLVAYDFWNMFCDIWFVFSKRKIEIVGTEAIQNVAQ